MSKRKYTAAAARLPSFLTAGKIQGGNDTYTLISESLVTSAAYMDLTAEQRNLYVTMLLQQYAHRTKPEQHLDKYQPEIIEQIKKGNTFYYPRNVAAKYNPKYKTSRGLLSERIKALVEHGFIDIVASGKSNRAKSIYAYSERWKKWARPP